MSAVMKFRADGTEKVKKDTAAIAGNLDRASKSADTLTGKGGIKRTLRGDGDGLHPSENKTSRGAAGLRGAAGRDFAGLAQAGGNTSGLVASYATLAANVFALTAAFKALSDASKATQLQKGLEQLGATSGHTLSIVAKGMQEMSGYSISAVEAMKSVAAATSAGFGGKDIERITRVARGASTALGRDMSDAIDRLTRGTIKLEPELLDELGIMTRIDEATRAYALTHNLAASALSTTQRRQAFLNAVLAEGESKFGDIADNVPVSAYDKLSASIRQFGTETIKVVNGALSPFIDALIAVPALGLLPLMGILKTAVGKLIPDMSAHIGNLTGKFNMLVPASRRAFETFSKFKSNSQAFISESGSKASAEMYNSILNASNKGNLFTNTDEIGAYKVGLKLVAQTEKEIVDSVKRGVAGKQEELRIVRELKKELIDQMSILQKQANFEKTNNAIRMQNRAAALATLNAKKLGQDLFENQGSILGTFGAIGRGIGRDVGGAGMLGTEAAEKEFKRLTETMGKGPGIITKMRSGMLGFGTAVANIGPVFGTVFQGIQAASGILFGIIATVSALAYLWSLVEEQVTGVTKKAKELKEETKAISENMGRTAIEVGKFIDKLNYGKAIDATISSLSELSAKLKELDEENKKRNNNPSATSNTYLNRYTNNMMDEWVANNQGEYATAEKITRKMTGKDVLDKAGITGDTQKEVANYTDLLSAAFGNAFGDKFVEALVKNPKDASKSLIDFADKLNPLLGTFTDMSAGIKEAGDALAKFRTPSYLVTEYTKVADSLGQVEIGYRAIEKLSPSLGGDIKLQLEKAFGQELLANMDVAIELDNLRNRATGQISSQFQQTAAGVEALKVQLKALQDTNENGVNNTAIAIIKKNLDDAFTTAKNMYTPQLQLLAIQKESEEKVAQTAIEYAKISASVASAKVESMKMLDAMAKNKRSIAAYTATGQGSLGARGDALEAINAAKQSYDYAVKTAAERKKVIQLETNLEVLKNKAAIEREESLVKRESGYFSGTLGYQKSRFEAFTQGPKAAGYSELTPTEIASFAEISKYLTTMRNMVGQIQALGTQNVANIGLEVQSLKSTLDLEVAKALALDQRLIKSIIELGYEEKKLGLMKETLSAAKALSDVNLSIREQRDITSANSRNRDVGSQAIYAREVQKLQNDIAFAKQQATLTATEHKIKMGNLELEHETLVLQNSLYMAQLAETKGIKPGDKLTLGFKAAAADKQAEANYALTKEYYAKLQFMAGLQGQAELKLLEGILINKLDPLSQFLLDYRKENQKAIDDKNRAGNTGVFAMADQGVADRIKDIASKSEGTGLTPENIQAMAVNQELLNASLTATDSIMSSIGSNFSTVFDGLINGTIKAKDAFKQFALAVLKDAAQIMTRLLILQTLQMFTGTGPMPNVGAGVSVGAPTGIPGISGQLSNLSGNLLPPGFANGGIASRSRMTSGIVSSPTILVGEGKHNEAVVPLPNGRSIPVQMHGGSSSKNNVVVNVNMGEGGNSATTQGPDMNNLGAAIAQAVQKELLAQKAPGGILNKYGSA